MLFISYRRKGDEDLAARIDMLLSQQFEVFRDLDDLVVGQNWKKQLDDTIGRSKALLLLVSEGWDCKRLKQEDDPVRRELNAAMSHAVPIVPIFAVGASPCQGDDLPPELRQLFDSHGYQLGGGTAFEPSVAALEKLLEEYEPSKRTLDAEERKLRLRKQRLARMAVALVATVVAGALGSRYVRSDPGTIPEEPSSRAREPSGSAFTPAPIPSPDHPGTGGEHPTMATGTGGHAASDPTAAIKAAVRSAFRELPECSRAPNACPMKFTPNKQGHLVATWCSGSVDLGALDTLTESDALDRLHAQCK